jgi:SAM-dependent methyltransferase
VADAYADAFGDEIADLPIDRQMLDLAVAAAAAAAAADGGEGWVLEAGCGPAPAAGYLARHHPELAVRVLGVDLSAAMLTAAGSRNPGLPTAQGNLLDLPLRDRSCSLVVAYYSLQHVPRAVVGVALGEARRVLRERGLLVMAMHLGDGDIFVEEFLGRPVGTLGGALYGRDELVGLLVDSGFAVEVERQRDPLPHEFDSRRLYLLARRTA